MLVSLGIGLGAFLAGAVVVWAVLAGRLARERLRLETEAAEKKVALEAERGRAGTLEVAQARLETENKRIPALEGQLEALQERCSGAERAKAALDSQLEAQKTVWQDAERSLSDKFDAMAAAALRNNNQSFLVLAKETLGNKQQEVEGILETKETAIANLLTPIQKKFTEFQLKVESLEKEGITGRTELKTQIEQLRTLNERLSADAANLVTALKGSSKTQGDWGELVLEKLLESAGLRRDFEYRVQKTYGREEGGNARLDVILDLPEDRHLVIDSKVSLNAYTDYCNTEGEEARKQALRQHLQSVRAHLKELSAREYQELYGLQSLDFVLMFVPVEPAFMVAIANDGRLWQDAYDRNVLLVSPSSLLCVVRTVAQIWRQERQSRNVEEIAKRGRILYDKFVGFTEDIQKIGRKLGDAREAYEAAYNKLTRADGNLVSQAQKLVKLGVKPNKTLPQPLLDQATQADEMLELAAVSEEPEDES